MNIPAELSAALLVFGRELSDWLDKEDKRLAGFSPLKSWNDVVSLMARDGNDFICNCPDCRNSALRDFINSQSH